MFFTRKDSALFCIVPSWSPSIKMDGVRPGKNTKVSIPGLIKPVVWKYTDNKLEIDLSDIHPNDIPTKIFVIKITNIL